MSEDARAPLSPVQVENATRGEPFAAGDVTRCERRTVGMFTGLHIETPQEQAARLADERVRLSRQLLSDSDFAAMSHALISGEMWKWCGFRARRTDVTTVRKDAMTDPENRER